jgi:hypothetical protein
VSDYYDREATLLVETNAQRYPDLLAQQLADAMRDASEAQRSWAQMKLVAIVAMRLAARADVKPKGDEKHLAGIASAWASGHPVTHGGNGWLDPQMVLADLERSPEDPEALIPDAASGGAA